MSGDVDTLKRVLRPFTRRGTATADGNIGGTTIVSLWDPAIPEGLQEGDDYWNGGQILILTGDMADEVREITDYVQATGVMTVAPRFVNPDVSLLSGNVLAAAVIIPVVDASVFTAGTAYIWDNAPNAEEVTITNVDTVTNQLTIAAPGLVNGYTVAANAAISMSPKILDGVEFVLMPPTTILDNLSLIEMKGAIFNTVVVAATDFFAADLAPTNTPCTFRVSAALNAAGVLDVIRTVGGVPVTEHLNENNNLAANCLYEFNITVAVGQTINLQHSVGGTILSCIVVELYQ